MKKRVFAILAVSAALMLSSVSYAGSDPSPGKATTIEKNVCPVYSCDAINFVATDLGTVVDQIQPVTSVSSTTVEKEAILVNENIPAALREHRRRVDKDVSLTANKKVISPGKPIKSDKFRDTHRRPC